MRARSRAESAARSRRSRADDDAYYRSAAIARTDPARARRERANDEDDAATRYRRDMARARRS